MTLDLEELADMVLSQWESHEGESMRDGHRHTMHGLIVGALQKAREAGRLEGECKSRIRQRIAEKEKA